MRTEELLPYLNAGLGERVTAYLGGGTNRTAMRGSDDVCDVRLREGYRCAYDSETAKAWMFGTNAQLEVEPQAFTTEQFADVRRAAQQFATAAA